MCGIVGITYFDKERKAEQPLLNQMLDLIRHRGPDDEGTYIENNVGIGMRRLSIIDLSGGHQPISNEDQTIWIVFNGEIYNFGELKEDLLKKGHRFATNTDTEVIIHQYEEDGENCVHKFNGMFAFCIWDKKKNRLFLSRDRMGVKPLYYYLDANLFVFSSEIKAMFTVKEIKKEVDLQSLYDYLTFRYVPAPRTMFAGISKLSAGYNLTIDLGQRKSSVSQYWDLKFKEPDEILSETEYLEQFSSLFRDAVKKRLISDVPLGVLLSGGLDSTAVTVAMNELGISKIKTFSVGFDVGGIYDESNYAETVTNHLGLENKKIVIGLKEFVDFLPDLVWYLDEPIADLASVPLYYVNKLARQDVTVVLSGEGSDELLAGYDFDRIVKRVNKVRQFLQIPQVLRKDIPVTLFRSLGFKSFADKLERLNLPLNVYSKERLFHITNVFPESEKRDILAKDFSYESSKNLLKRFYDNSGTDDPLNQILYVYWKSWLAEDLLNKADKMSMANSIELRVPFLDYRLVELVASFPTRLKVGRNQQGEYYTKYILRKMLENKIPREIVYRGKLGFPVPAYQWLKKELNSYSKDILLNSSSGFFNKQEIENLFIQLERGDNESPAKIWNLVIFELWYEKFFMTDSLGKI